MDLEGSTPFKKNMSLDHTLNHLNPVYMFTFYFFRIKLIYRYKLYHSLEFSEHNFLYFFMYPTCYMSFPSIILELP